ncbi:unnamed protein product [Amoebophrya sp. A25]|nr:unnamed protein product [Amoebophrya sp. A25]|eukprot:GSA25T00006970001.1
MTIATLDFSLHPVVSGTTVRHEITYGNSNTRLPETYYQSSATSFAM